MMSKNEHQEKYGFTLKEMNDCYLLVKNQRLVDIVKEKWFEELLEKLSEAILTYYSDFQIYLAHVNYGKEDIVLGYVYVNEEENKTGETVSDVNLNKAMSDITTQVQEIRLLFVTMQAKKRKLKKLKKGNIKEHFNVSRYIMRN